MESIYAFNIFQQESPCSRRHGLTTKHVSGLGCTSVLNGYTQGHAAAGRLYTTRDDLTLVLVAVKGTFAFLLHKSLCPCPVVFRRPSLQARQPRDFFLVTSVSTLSKQAPTTSRSSAFRREPLTDLVGHHSFETLHFTCVLIQIFTTEIGLFHCFCAHFFEQHPRSQRRRKSCASGVQG